MDILRNAKEGFGFVKKTYADTGLDGHVNKAAGAVAQAVKAGGEVIGEVIGEGLDSISGQRMFDLVQERMAVQDQYNDVLASKLHEALQRIERLEEALNGKK